MADQTFRPAPSLRADGKGRDSRLRNLLAALPLLAAMGLGACVAPMPLKEGPGARLISGIKAPRDRNNMDITLYEYSVTAWGKCLELASTRSPMSAVFSVITLSPYHACSVVPKDHELAAGQRPWCIVAVPKGDEELLEHELRHCEGWAAPDYGVTTALRDGADSEG